jgi:hypothetical protein
MIFQIYKAAPSTKQLFHIPFQNGHYDVKLINVYSFYANAGSQYSLMIMSDRLNNNSKEYIQNMAPRTAFNVSGLILRAKAGLMENIYGSSGYWNLAFLNQENADEFSWKDVYLDGYLDLVIYAAGLISGNAEPVGAAPPNLNACLFTFDITPSKNKFSLKEYLKLENLENLKSIEI